MNHINPVAAHSVELEFAQSFALGQYLQQGKELFIGLPEENNHVHLRSKVLQAIIGQTLLIRPLAQLDQLDVRVKINTATTLSVRMAVPEGVLCFAAKQLVQPQQDHWTLELQWPEQMHIEQSRQFLRVAMHQAMLVARTGDMRRRAMMLNLSEQGMQVEYHAPLGKIGDELSLLVVLPFAQGALSIEATALIRSKYSEICEDHVVHGLEFRDLSESASRTICRYMQERLSAQNDGVMPN